MNNLPMTEAKDLYLDLMKKVLAFTLWPEPLIPIDAMNDSRSYWKKLLAPVIAKALKRTRFRLAIVRNVSMECRETGGIWPGYAHTMIGIKRLDNLQSCIETVLRENVPGDLIETGVWRGGACIFMRAVLAAHGVENRKVFVADSFEGLPAPDAKSYPADAGDTHHIHNFLVVSQEEVEENFRRYGLMDHNVVFIKGWFKDTLPEIKAEKFAIIRLDGDMYSSTTEALESLYPKLAIGGFCIIDDYDLPTCQKAVDDFRKKYSITPALQEIDFTGRYWRKDEASRLKPIESTV